MNNIDVWTHVVGYCDLFTICNLKLVSSEFCTLKSKINWREQYFYFFEKDQLIELDWETKFHEVFTKTNAIFYSCVKEYQMMEIKFEENFESLVEFVTEIQKEKILKEEDFQNIFYIENSIFFLIESFSYGDFRGS
jgi:hypothetical protein